MFPQSLWPNAEGAHNVTQKRVLKRDFLIRVCLSLSIFAWRNNGDGDERQINRGSQSRFRGLFKNNESRFREITRSSLRSTIYNCGALLICQPCVEPTSSFITRSCFIRICPSVITQIIKKESRTTKTTGCNYLPLGRPVTAATRGNGPPCSSR